MSARQTLSEAERNILHSRDLPAVAYRMARGGNRTADTRIFSTDPLLYAKRTWTIQGHDSDSSERAMRWLGGAISDAEDDLPDRSPPHSQGAQPRATQQLVDPSDRVDKRPKGVPCSCPKAVLPARVQPDVPPIPWKARRPVAPGSRRGGQQQRLQLGIAAKHAIKRDEIRRRDRRGEGEEVAVQELHPLGVAPAIGFVLACPNVRAGGLDVHGGADPAGQKLVVQHPDASADVEERVGSCVGFAQQAKELPGRAFGTPPSVRGELLLGSCRSEVAISGFAVACHGWNQ
jgi:hypothetical protein